MKSPNIVFLHVDQLNRRAVGAWGASAGEVRTPNLDELAARGMKFESCYVTIPQCVPSRTSWYTGLVPEESGVTNNGTKVRFPADLPDLGSQLRKAGYDSIYMGKWHVNSRPVERSFDMRHSGSKLGELSDAGVARTAEAFIANREAGANPFFLNIGLTNPHDICYWSREPLGPAKSPLAESIKKDLPILPPNHHTVAAGYSADKSEWTEMNWRFYRYSYYRFVEMVDEEIGRIVRSIKNSPFSSNTILIFSSDHGHANGEHLHLTKNTLYEHGVNVPLIIYDPGAKSGCCDQSRLVSSLDIPATICDYAGVEPMPGCRGLSLRAIVGGKAPSQWRNYVTASTAKLKSRMIRRGDLKLICDRAGNNGELYDLKQDPWELTNLADRAEHAETVRLLKDALKKHEAEYRLHPQLEAELNPKGKPAQG
jgi:choline-sulfatase